MYIKTILQKDEIVSRQLKGVFLQMIYFIRIFQMDSTFWIQMKEVRTAVCFILTPILPNFSSLWVSLQSYITPILEIILLHRIDPTNIFVNNFKAPILMFKMNDN